MARDLTTAQEDALQSDNTRLGFVYESFFNDKPLRAWTGYESLFFDSDGDGNDEEFLGVGDFASFGGISETTDVKSEDFSVVLADIPNASLAYDTPGEPGVIFDEALEGEFQGESAKLWMAILNDDGTVIDDPIEINSGFQDEIDLDDDGGSLTIELKIATPMKNLRGKSTLHNTAEDQRSLHEGDGFFDHVSDIQDKKEEWGSNLN